MARRRTIIPLGEFMPDAGEFGGADRRLIECRNLVPVYGNYCVCPSWDERTAQLPSAAYGLHAHSRGGGDYRVYYGDATALWEVNPTGNPWPMTDVSRLVGGAYNTAGAGGENGWQAVSAGDNVIFTNYVDDPQILVSGAANFTKLAQSGGANPGYDPKAKFVTMIRDNLFLADCNLSAPYDNIPTGANPFLVAWSQDGVFQQFGSPNVDGELIGSDYAQVNNDYGNITNIVGAGSFGILSQERAFVRIDGPPYQFRVIVDGVGTRFPNAMRAFDGNVYGWGPGGPFVLIGGEGPIRYLAAGKLIRTLIDNTTSFSPDNSIAAGIDIKHVSLAIDPTNRLLLYTITSRSRSSVLGTTQEGNLSIWYNIDEERFSFATSSVGATAVLPGVLYLHNRPDTGETWMPGRTSVGVIHLVDDLGTVDEYIGTPTFTSSQFGPFPSVRKPFIQLDPERVTRITRIRPIYASGVQAPVTLSVAIYSKSRTYAAPTTSGPYAALDTHGFVVTPDTVFGELHSPQIAFGDQLEDMTSITSLSAIEVEYETGGVYAE